ncbi:MAG: membrane protein insertase YidC, partial [Tistlia sp.]|uniref:membrane protein insertase YidC n=1 Tax=Tistlia sp. TaxID=3057121 RepID=UPI0034A50797
QIPVFFALYKVLFVTIEMRHAPFFGWIQDLSAPDPTTVLNLFGLLPWDRPELGALDIVNLGVWPLLMGLTMFLQQRLNPQPADPIQAKIFTFMPIMFTFLLAHFPAGLVIYWTWNNTLSIVQQAFIMKRLGVPFGGKQDFMPGFKGGTRAAAKGSGKGAAKDKGDAKGVEETEASDEPRREPAEAPLAIADGSAAEAPAAKPAAAGSAKPRAKKGASRSRGRNRGKAR